MALGFYLRLSKPWEDFVAGGDGDPVVSPQQSLFPYKPNTESQSTGSL